MLADYEALLCLQFSCKHAGGTKAAVLATSPALPRNLGAPFRRHSLRALPAVLGLPELWRRFWPIRPVGIATKDTPSPLGADVK